MKNISGHYTDKHKKTVKFNIDIPSSWAELDKHTFASVIQLLHFRNADRYTISVSLLALLFGQKNFHILSGLADEDLHVLVSLTDFLVSEKPPVKNFFPQLKMKGKVHTAPADNLSNLSFGEWCFAYDAYNFYHLTKDPLWLDTLIATIYRPVDPTENEDSATFSGDTREKFNENLIGKRAKSVGAIEERIKLGVLAWFSVALSEAVSTRPHVFPPRDTAAEVDPDASTSMLADGESPDSWLTIFRQLLGPKWGTTNDLKYTNAMFILDELEEKQIEYEKVKRGR